GIALFSAPMRIAHVTPAVLFGALLLISVACVVTRAADTAISLPHNPPSKAYLAGACDPGTCNEAAASPRPATNSTRVLVLRDGGVLAGQITRVAHWYVVSRDGGQIQVEMSRVVFACGSLEEAYELQRKQLNNQNADPHLALAAWCLRFNLLADAGRELSEARRIDPNQPRLTLLERRLETMSKSSSKTRLRAGKAPAEPRLATLSARQEVRSASFEIASSEPADSRQTVVNAKTSTRSPKPSPTSAEIPTDLPDGVIERFTRKVQPVLVNDCTTSGCHQRGSAQSFQLDRAILRGESNRRTTMYNLQAALALVNRQHPEKSPLLTIPRTPHGGMSAPIFGPRQEQAYQHLIDWVALVAPPAHPRKDDATPAKDQTLGSAPPEKHMAGTLPPLHPAVNAGHSFPVEHLSAGKHALKTRPAQVNSASLFNEATTIDDAQFTLRPPHQLKYGARLESWAPRDPFDPEIFNRQLQSQKAQIPAQADQTTAAEKH
ncbi:MAG TPA: hypothetical protein VHE81_15770, partial [Lacipirellulaceae bacterium]|nr:hypothetical protein [Lacipirellulaceae bacterium]